MKTNFLYRMNTVPGGQAFTYKHLIECQHRKNSRTGGVLQHIHILSVCLTLSYMFRKSVFIKLELLVMKFYCFIILMMSRHCDTDSLTSFPSEGLFT